MSLAHPFALWGLLLLPLLALFYMWRAQHRRRVVSSTMLWIEAFARFNQRPTRRLPLRDPLLLLQLLAAMALILLLAGPGFARTIRLQHIVVLDDSVAMAATDVSPTRLAAAQKRIHDLIAGLGGDERLSVIVAGPQAHLLGEIPSDVDLSDLVDRLTPSAGAADLVGAAALVRGLIATPGRGAPRITFLAGAQTPALPAGSLPVDTVRLGGALDDQSIDTFTVRCPAAGGACQAFARVRNTASQPRARDLTVLADGHLLGHETLHLPATGSINLTFAVPPGAHILQASVPHDALPADDSAWALVPSQAQVRVLLVSDSPDALLHVLSTLPGVQAKALPTASYRDAATVGFDLVVADNYAPDTVPAMPTLLINPPADNVLIPVHSAGVYLPIDAIDAQDPLVAGLDLHGLATTGEQIAEVPWAHVAIGGTKGPLLLHGILGGQRVAVVPFDLSSSPFTRDLAYPLLMARLVHWLVPLVTPSVTFGASVWLPPTVLSVRDSNGQVLSGPVVSATSTGVYRVASSYGGLAADEPLFAVAAAGPGDTVPAAAMVQDWTLPRPTGTLPFFLWPLILLLGLVALGGEWVVYARKT